MYWVLQENLFNEVGFARLVCTLEKFKLPYSVHKFLPFTHRLEPDTNPTGKVIVMGTYSLTQIAVERGWQPGSFASSQLDYLAQRPHWGKEMLNRDALVCFFKNVPPQKNPFFLRPSADSKDFSGFVTDWGEFSEWRDRVLSLPPEDTAQLHGKTLVMVCSKKEIWSETRCWVVRGNVVTASEYKRGTIVRYSSTVDERIVNYAAAQAQHWSPCEAFVLDIADTPAGLKILEAGNLNSAGFYEADLQKLVAALEDCFGC